MDLDSILYGRGSPVAPTAMPGLQTVSVLGVIMHGLTPRAAWLVVRAVSTEAIGKMNSVVLVDLELYCRLLLLCCVVYSRPMQLVQPGRDERARPLHAG